MVDVVKEVIGVDFWNEMIVEEVWSYVKEYGIEIINLMIVGYIINEFFE